MWEDRSSSGRKAACAGTWYPEDARVLQALVTKLLAQVDVISPGGELRALVVPHAGIAWSGATAAHGYACIDDAQIQTVLVMSPNHREYVRGAAVDPSTWYETPLGRTPVDAETVAALQKTPHFEATPHPFLEEHAIEMQLPFLQTLLPEARLIPVIVGKVSTEQIDEIAASLKTCIPASTLIVVSSDFMHFGSMFGYVPFTSALAERIRQLDAEAIEEILAGSESGFQEVLERTGNTICGQNPIKILLRLMQPNWQGELRQYTNSGEITGDWSHSVSYAALAFRSSTN